MMRIPESELIINSDGSAFHIHLRPEELADDVILVGDPGRVDMIAEFLTDIEYRHASREFVSVAGKYNGKRFTVLSHGIGTDNIDIVMTELDALANIDFETREVKEHHRSLNILRIGTSGAIQPDIPLGSYVFSEISLGCDGLLNWYGNRDAVALKDYEDELMRHMNWSKYLPVPYFVPAGKGMTEKFRGRAIFGITISASGFYGPQGRVIRIPLAMPDMVDGFESYSCKGRKITNFEMEGSALAGLAAHLGHNAATICCIIAQRHAGDSNTEYKGGIRELVEYCLNILTE
ncbi:MAG: nucleoside phosphorylase [Bacteroidales bacterium]|nr:nucleoside phosphorylase [Candidatus Cryptobacteroides caccocaballi]